MHNNSFYAGLLFELEKRGQGPAPSTAPAVAPIRAPLATKGVHPSTPTPVVSATPAPVVPVDASSKKWVNSFDPRNNKVDPTKPLGSFENAQKIQRGSESGFGDVSSMKGSLLFGGNPAPFMQDQTDTLSLGDLFKSMAHLTPEVFTKN